MDHIITTKILGQGLFGITYLAKDTNTNDLYALKRQKILKKDIIKNPNHLSPLQKELYFFKYINHLPPPDQQFFMKLIEYKFYKCNFNIKRNSIPPDKKLQAMIHKLDASPYCLDFLVDLKDGIVIPLVFKSLLSTNQIYSMVTQCLYAIHLMREGKFIHYDDHMGNIAYVRCPSHEKVIIHFNNNKKYTFPSFGYRFSLIDYGLIKHKSFPTTQKDQNEYNIFFKSNEDLTTLIYTMILGVQKMLADAEKAKRQLVVPRPEDLLTSNPDMWTKIKHTILSYYTDDYFPKWYKQIESNTLTNKLKKDPRQGIIQNEIMIWVAIYDKKLFCKMHKHKYIPNLINDEDIKLMVLNRSNMPTIIKHFIDLLVHF